MSEKKHLKSFIQICIIAAIIITSLLAFPYWFYERDLKTYSDEELRAKALGIGLKPVPKTYEELLKVVNSKENPMSAQKIILGKKLFFDTNLSQNRSISCATCHMIKENQNAPKQTLQHALTSDKNNPSTCVACHLEEQSGTDRLETSIGHNNTLNPKNLNTTTVLNSALAHFLTWSGDVKNLEEQAANSIQDAHKMTLLASILPQRLEENSQYKKMFYDAFHNENPNTKELYTLENTSKALASYVRTLMTRGAYDEFLDGDNEAISQTAKKGLSLFINLGCKGCHAGMSVGGISMQTFPIRRFATVYDLRPNLKLYPKIEYVDIKFPFENKGGFTGQDITNKFRVPILRNVTKTSPYFHNGSVAKIREAVNIMAKHQLGANLTPTQLDEIVAFLQTLEGEIVSYDIPTQTNKGAFNEAH